MKRLLPPIAVIVVAMIATPAAAGDWSQSGQNTGNTNVATSDSTIGVHTVASLGEAWARNLDGSAVVDTGRVFVDPPGDSALRILDLATGKTTATIDDGPFQGPAAVSGDAVVVQRPTQYASDGSTVAKSAVAAYSITTGTRQWLVPAGVGRYLGPEPTGDLVPPTIAAGKVFPGGSTGSVPRPAIDLVTGAVAFTTAFGGDWAAKVVVGDGIVATVRGESGGVVQVFDSRDGSFLWEKRRTWASLALIGSTLVVSEGSSLSAFDAATGTRLWSSRSDRTLRGVAVTGSMIVGVVKEVSNGVQTGELRGWSLADGHRLWRDWVGNSTTRFTEPIVTNGVAMVGRWQPGGAASVVAIDRATGNVLLELPVGNGPIGGLAVVNDTLLVPGGGVLHAFRIT